MSTYTLFKTVPRERKSAYTNIGWTPHTASAEDSPSVQLTKVCLTNVGCDDAHCVEATVPYLVQRGTIRRPLGGHRDARLTRAVNMDYMGAAEFEFGALPASLRRVEAQFSLFKTVLAKNIVASIPVKGVEREFTLRLYANFDTDEQRNTYITQLADVFFGTRHTKESLHLYLDSAAGTYRLTDTDFWWDIENDVFMSFDKQFMSGLQQNLQQSIAWLNSTPEVS